MFTRGVKINYITVWSYPNTPRLPADVSSRTPSPPRRESPHCWWWRWRWLSRIFVLHLGCRSPLNRTLLPLSPRVSKLLKIKRFGSKQASEAQYSRGGVLAFFFFQDNTWAQHYRGRPWKEQAVVFPIGGRFVSLRPMLHRTDGWVGWGGHVTDAILRSSLWPERRRGVQSKQPAG